MGLFSKKKKDPVDEPLAFSEYMANQMESLHNDEYNTPQNGVEEDALPSDERSETSSEDTWAATEPTPPTDESDTSPHQDITVDPAESSTDPIDLHEEFHRELEQTDDIPSVSEDIPSDEEPYVYSNQVEVVGTEIFNQEIEDAVGGFGFTSDYGYRIGYEDADAATIFTLTKKDFKTPFTVNRNHSSSDISWYNDLAALGYSFAVIRGQQILGVIICEPQYWNNTLVIRHLQVAADCRRQGLGSELIERCAMQASNTKFRALAVEVQSINGAAIDFYKKNLFHMVGLNVELYSNSDLRKGDVGLFLHRNIR